MVFQIADFFGFTSLESMHVLIYAASGTWIGRFILPDLFIDGFLQDGRRNGEGNSYAHDRHGYDRPHQYDTQPMYNGRPPYGRGAPSTEEDDRAIALALQEEERHSECQYAFLNFLLWFCLIQHCLMCV